MKKVSAIKSITNLALFALLALVSSCGDSSGLGEAVDLTAPVVTLTSHNDNDSVASTFTLKGTVWDNEAVKSLAIDFDDAGIHYYITPGGVWQKNSTATGNAWAAMDEGKAECTKSGDTWIWSVYVDTTNDKITSFDDTTYTLSAVAVDSSGNSGKNSKVDCSLIVDTKDPNVTINKPDIFTTYSNVSSKFSLYNLKDGNILARLMNGDITFSIQQSGAMSFKELRVEFDNGTSEYEKKKTENGGTTTYEDTESIANAITGDSTAPTIYYTKTLKVNENGISDLRAIDLTVKADEWATSEKGIASGLNTGKHIIRIVTTSISPSNTWQRKVVGYFVWWPEADTPWVTAYQGDDTDKGDDASEVYPGSNMSGTAQDDDGIKSLTYTLEKKETENNETVWQAQVSGKSLNLSESGAKYSAWSLQAPTLNGNYRLTVKVTDIYGKSDETTKYFKTLDIKPPTIEFDDSSAKNASSALTSNHEITFSGLVSDDGDISSLKVVYLNPDLANDAANKIKYMSGTDTDWDEISNGSKDESGNIVYDLTSILEPVSEASGTYKFSKTFDVFNDLKIDGTTKKLSAQDFVFRVVDKGGTKTVKMISLTGDSEAPSLTFDKIVLTNNGVTKSYDMTSEIPTFPEIKSGATAVLSGTWGDNSFDKWGVTDGTIRIGKVTVTWNGTEKGSVTPLSNKTWSMTIDGGNVPSDSGTIKVSLADFGGNEKAVTKSVFIESGSTKLERIGSDSDDGSYNKDKEILITLEFTKNTTWSGTEPSLTLNNGGTAVYENGNDTAKHVFKYTVKGNTSETTDQLLVSSINQSGTKWKETTSGSQFTVSLPEETKTLKTRNIKVDTTAPTISEITAITPAGAYKAGSDIMLMVEFSEAVTVSATSGELKDNLKINFANSLSTTDASASGSKFVIFTYTVKDGENSDKLKYSSLTHENVTVTDEAGNELANWTPAKVFDKAIAIDTSAPDAPTVNAAWGSAEVVINESGTSFYITGETGAAIEYTVDGSSYQTYASSYDGTKKIISLTNNGTYTIIARQTDKAGNVSDESSPVTVTVDKGELLTGVSASTFSGTYSTEKGKKIDGIITFRKAVTIESGATVTLNVTRDGTTGIEVPVNECESDAGTASQFTFTYEIKDGDKIADNAMLDVTAWSFDSVKLGTTSSTVSMAFDDVVTSGKAFTDNREIYILTGKPTVKSVTLKGKGEKAVLTVKFDRKITKLGGTNDSGSVISIGFEQTDEDYRVPAVLSVSDYGSLFSSSSTISTYYEKSQNGAILSGTTLTNDTSTKYVLKYKYDTINRNDNDISSLINILKDAGYNKRNIPVVASAVDDGSAASEDGSDTLTVTLGTAYELPVMGAKYKLTIPANTVVDAAQNKNDVNTSYTLTAEGVEKPTIRINKTAQTITSSGTTSTSSVTQPSTASIKMDCQTPNTTIYYDVNTKDSTVVHVNQSPNKDYDTDTGAATVPTSLTNEYSNSFTIGNTISDYSSATGKKFAIAAYAKQGSDSSEKSYEYATRTVLKLTITGKSDSNGNQASNITENGSTLYFRDLKVWVFGGDAPYGGNTLDPFPLSWNDSAYFKLMSGSWTDTGSLLGNWYWVSWDITTETYHGFVIGDVPADASTLGPTKWYAGECAWVAQKTHYILRPGENLEMAIENAGTYQANFLFRIKNEGTR